MVDCRSGEDEVVDESSMKLPAVVGLSLFDELRYSFSPPLYHHLPLYRRSRICRQLMTAVNVGIDVLLVVAVGHLIGGCLTGDFPHSLLPNGFWTLLNLVFAVNFGFTARMDNFGCRLPAWIFTVFPGCEVVIYRW